MKKPVLEQLVESFSLGVGNALCSAPILIMLRDVYWIGVIIVAALVLWADDELWLDKIFRLTEVKM